MRREAVAGLQQSLSGAEMAEQTTVAGGSNHATTCSARSGRRSQQGSWEDASAWGRKDLQGKTGLTEADYGKCFSWDHDVKVSTLRFGAYPF